MRGEYSALGVVVVGSLTATLVGCSRAESPRSEERATSSAASATSGSVDPCALMSQGDVAAAVGNPVAEGQHQGAGTCKWESVNRDDVGVLLIAHRKGEIREPYLCEPLLKDGGNERVEGLEVAKWDFSNTMGFFNTGEFEGCGPKGYISLQLNGRRDEARLKQATLAIVKQVLARP
jgi:hypothetical protein